MKKKYLKIMSVIAVALLTVVLGNSKAEAVTDQEFSFDWAFHFTMPDELKPGYNDITINTASKNENTQKDNAGTEKKDVTDLKQVNVNYRIVEITKDMYDKFKVLQDKIVTPGNVENGISQDNNDLKSFMELMKETYSDYQFWCYNDTINERIKVDANCETKYYMVTVDVELPGVVLHERGDVGWEYQTARVYEVKADKTACPKCKIVGDKYYDSEGNEIAKDEYEKACPKGNPSTGINTPYIILGSVALGAALIVLVSKKKKFI